MKHCAYVKDAIRYTFVYHDDTYTDGFLADCARLENGRVWALFDRRNSWDQEGVQRDKHPMARFREQIWYLFEVQFHTQAQSRREGV